MNQNRFPYKMVNFRNLYLCHCSTDTFCNKLQVSSIFITFFKKNVWKTIVLNVTERLNFDTKKYTKTDNDLAEQICVRVSWCLQRISYHWINNCAEYSKLIQTIDFLLEHILSWCIFSQNISICNFSISSFHTNFSLVIKHWGNL